jgi:hypothetical protein
MKKSRICPVFFLPYMIIILFSCNEGPQAKKTPTVDSVILSPPQGLKQSYPIDTLVTERLLQLAKFLDSSGYSFDTNRLKKTYNLTEGYKKEEVKGYIFYLSAPERYLQTVDSDSSDTKIEHLDRNVYRKARSIATYFYTNRTPELMDGKKWYMDGLINEWKFPDSNSAKKAAIDLAGKQETIFANSGNLVCYIDNYLYVFSSRSSGYMYSITKFFKIFVKNNHGTITCGVLGDR